MVPGAFYSHFSPWCTLQEPGTTQGGFSTYQGSMPIGNGAFTALSWPNISNGGVGIMLGHQKAMSSATELFKLGLIQVSLSPNPFLQGAFFNQTLDIATATVIVYAGGSSFADYAVGIRVWIDANADALYVDIESGDGTSPYSLTTTIESVRPSAPYSYTPVRIGGKFHASPRVRSPCPRAHGRASHRAFL